VSNKIHAHHLDRRAYVHVRQSTARQVLENAESTARQYAPAERARALGWSSDAIAIIDGDLGRSGKTSETRSGFGCLSPAVANGEAGAIALTGSGALRILARMLKARNVARWWWALSAEGVVG
jgi:hypothetical protein